MHDPDIWQRRNCELSEEITDRLNWAINNQVTFRLRRHDGYFSFIAQLPAVSATISTEVPLEQKALAKFNADLNYALMSLQYGSEHHGP